MLLVSILIHQYLRYSHVHVTKASWYSTKESKGIPASGVPLDDRRRTAASWDYPLGTELLVRYGRQTVQCKVTDRGPGKKALSHGVTLDLSQRAFSELTGGERGLAKGIIVCQVYVVKN